MRTPWNSPAVPSLTVGDTRRARLLPAALTVVTLLLSSCGGAASTGSSAGAGTGGDGGAGGGTASGVYVGAAAPDAVRAFGDWRGSQPTIAVDFLADETWEKIAEPTWWVDGWRDQGLDVAYSVPLLPDTGGTLAEGAAGDYDEHFTSLARTLVAGGQGDARLRLGWEFNGGWYAWSASEDSGRPGASPEHFVGYWRSIVDAMRTVEGADFRFVWNPNRGYEQFPAEQAWPGADYVDEIGVDVYDQSWIEDFEDPEARFEEILEGDHGLLWFADFAEEHDKPLVVPEWGLTIREDGHGGGDNEVFVKGMHEFFAEHDVSWEAYFEFDAPDGLHSLQSGTFPLGAAQYLCRFGESGTACPDRVESLSDLLPAARTENGWGPVERDQSNGEDRARDGRTLTLQGREFATGLGVHAPSAVQVTVPEGCTSLTSTVGVDDETPAGSVVFRVDVDGVRRFDSGVRTGSSPNLPVSVAVEPGREVRLEVTDAGDGADHDHADWAGAELVCPGAGSRG